MDHTAYIGMGSNLGDRSANLKYALKKIADNPDISLAVCSSKYETAPVGVKDQPFFINMVVKIKTRLKPGELLEFLQGLEKFMGRKRERRWGPRVIDLDILLYDKTEMSSPELTLPHPRMSERAFVLVPLFEIEPEIELPTGEKIKELLSKLDDSQVFRFKG